MLLSVPELDLVDHLPELLDGLFVILDGENPEIRISCEEVLYELLMEVNVYIVWIIIVHELISLKLLRISMILSTVECCRSELVQRFVRQALPLVNQSATNRWLMCW